MAKATGKKAAAAPTKAVAAKKSAAPKAAPKKAEATAAPKKAPAKKAVAAKKAPAKKAAQVVDQRPLLEKLFIDGLKDIYWAEKSSTKALPRLMKAATSDQLKQAFEQHAKVTEQQIARVEQVFQLIGIKAVAKKCEAMEGLTKEADSIISETQKGTMTRDAGLILAAQKVEHYEIASYGGLAQLAATLGMEEAKNLLGQTLQEEKDSDELLTQVAISTVNLGAEAEDEEEDIEEEESDPV
ncbi:MAG TPA: ferritin-like domain-containing protein [Segetibacter sp.]|jgi:ferritin-like metal-binding protein YciE